MRFEVPACRHCGGVLKPDVVFFGESVPSARVEAAMAHLQTSAGVLVVGSSLMVLSATASCVPRPKPASRSRRSTWAVPVPMTC